MRFFELKKKLKKDSKIDAGGRGLVLKKSGDPLQTQAQLAFKAYPTMLLVGTLICFPMKPIELQCIQSFFNMFFIKILFNM